MLHYNWFRNDRNNKKTTHIFGARKLQKLHQQQQRKQLRSEKATEKLEKSRAISLFIAISFKFMEKLLMICASCKIFV